MNKPLPKSYDELYQDHFLRILLEETWSRFSEEDPS